jgi:uncharacterized protein YceH (UPF0502 family)
MILSDVEVRVVGSLVEKQVTTPDYYPLTLNALVHACNQTSNRDPVVAYDERTISEAIESLREKNLVYVFYGSESRVPKYKHVMTEILHLTPAELAIMCVLMLRGAQTVGELRGRTGRLYEFTGLEEVEATLDALMTRDEQPLVMRLARASGQKEARYAHLLAGEANLSEQQDGSGQTPQPRRVRGAVDERIGKLELEVEDLKAQFAVLQEAFDNFRKQFE